ncbi:MAG TPA: sigma-54 dependent transcriptional regulator [Woeseiaceae bacterium]|nr:sigma-54 dependent transcriptional regulator [Woeseiaceae bacterium]
MSGGKQDRGRVWVLDTDSERAASYSDRLRFLGYEPVVADAEKCKLSGAGIAVLIGDITDKPLLAKTVSEIRRRHPSLPFICHFEQALADAGPSWKLARPAGRGQLQRLLNRAERYQGTERRQRITGSSHPIRQVRNLIEQVADFDTTVLITGQSGTGKELVARTIHDLSARSDKPFVPINCGAIPAELLESELFGHEKGSFTGAISSRQGRFELAQGGTLFLDEIGEMSMDMQVKLLRVLQERSFERVGSNHLQDCDVRVVAATHVDLPLAIKEGRFREDLFYRLNVFPIEMPPLYQRVSDLPQLVDELLLARSGEEPDSLRMSPAVMNVLAMYRWPGNIRELSNLVERLAIVKPQGTIELADLPARYTSELSDENDAPPTIVSSALQMGHINLKQHLQAVEQDLIGQAMQASGGVVAKAARLLSMQRTTLVEKIGKYQLAS